MGSIVRECIASLERPGSADAGARIARGVLLCSALAAAIPGAAAAYDQLRATEYQITTSFLAERGPRLGASATGEVAVYVQFQSDGLGDIFYQPLLNGAPDGGSVPVAVTPGVDEQQPDVSGDFIIYRSLASGVVIYRISDAATWSFGDPLLVNSPRIDGHWAIWNNQGRIVLYDLNDLGTAAQPQPISGIPATDGEIGDRFAVWIESGDVVVWDLASSTATVVGSAGSDVQPTTSGPWVAWMAASGPTRILAANMDLPGPPVVTVVDDGSTNLRPSLDGDLVAWESNKAGHYDIWVSRLATGGAPKRVVADPSDQQNAHVFGQLVTYVGDPAFNDDVWVSALEFVPTDIVEVVVTLDDVPATQCDETWSEGDVELSVIDTTAEDCDGGGRCSLSASSGLIDLVGARLNLDLSGLRGTVVAAEVDVQDSCGPGCTRAFLYQGANLLASAANTTSGDQTLLLDGGGPGADRLAVSGCESSAVEIRLQVAVTRVPALATWHSLALALCLLGAGGLLAVRRERLAKRSLP